MFLLQPTEQPVKPLHLHSGSCCPAQPGSSKGTSKAWGQQQQQQQGQQDSLPSLIIITYCMYNGNNSVY